jgi:Fe-S-cluster containining protein
MAEDRAVSLQRQAGAESWSAQSSFKFHCHEGLDCFNQCCHTPTIILSPYDIVQLKSFLGLSSGEFLQHYTLEVIEESSNLPLVCLDPYRTPEGGCPFLGAAGCTVYPRRPAACRLFPITMGSQLTEAGLVDHYFCRHLDYCRGFDGEREWTVASWQANQGFVEYDQGRREWLEILLRAGIKGPGEVDARVQEHVATAAYDLDAFRRLLRLPGFRRTHSLDDLALEELRRDDLALLKFGYGYLKALLFSEPLSRTGG